MSVYLGQDCILSYHKELEDEFYMIIHHCRWHDDKSAGGRVQWKGSHSGECLRCWKAVSDDVARRARFYSQVWNPDLLLWTGSGPLRGRAR